MSGFAIRGWCPDAWHPMMAGDGLLLRVKPRLGVLTRAQVLDLCDAAQAYGSGAIDLTRRANLQLRGVREGEWHTLLQRLIDGGLVDADPVRETRRNVLVAPDWQAGDDTHRIANELFARLDELPELPNKIGFIVDAGPACMLHEEAGDFHIERGEAGGLILRADGRVSGIVIEPGQEVDGLIALARWFVSSGGASAGRMARHEAALPDWAVGTAVPSASRSCMVPGRHELGMAYGLAFGRVEAGALAAAMQATSAGAVRVTPWRVILLEGASGGQTDGLLDDPADPLLHVDACPGAPSCPQATVATRELARALAPHVAGRLHVSGCAKGCAHPGVADVTLTGREGVFYLALNARAGAPPIRSGLRSTDLLRHFGAA